ncbi:Hypothetical protein GbCGDNIH2_7114 [Granulibacter bethesdensis]|uniref:Uncharacterized protein n=1 Tax=Granulibacter bethesdensis (strain ATCC BAA-1260 / CGDNIH1) TaxID=391165 RepID=A0A286M356_GRABC|nr:Hypothetical protein GbCGDNIH2_7114 [Granulibacter bethesdensis]APH52441.1 Hypothetical protein GbCGDNIH5_7114 [Granulibacter bethesdensis]APH65131.1 Hypothetical protein GbCGDNIH1I4_7114 [Granulibacter bethesdensis]ASV62455.1 Hypothetical protein GbCGDNIH1_7114 [Granulibacter bethesdensis CGDNIH1]
MQIILSQKDFFPTELLCYEDMDRLKFFLIGKLLSRQSDGADGSWMHFRPSYVFLRRRLC